jgi:hypothetical protein
MPNASRKHRKKFSHPRRIEVTDEDGWTHVSNTHSVPSSRSTRIMTDGAGDDPDHNESTPDNQSGSTTIRHLLAPSEPPPKLTLIELRKQFNTHLETWESSQTWQQLKNALSKDILNQSQIGIENIVCIGLGSPSGFVQGGWVDRRSVAMYQLAALTTIIDCVKQHNATSSPTQQDAAEMKIMAQDPVFNALDIELLCLLGMTVVDSPEGFNDVTEKTLLFAPGAERRHLRLMLPADPVMVFGGPLEEGPSLTARSLDDDTNEDDDSKCLTNFVAQTRSVKIQEFEARPETFWRMRIYWREEK